jgi:hypothetical protein
MEQRCRAESETIIVRAVHSGAPVEFHTECDDSLVRFVRIRLNYARGHCGKHAGAPELHFHLASGAMSSWCNDARAAVVAPPTVGANALSQSIQNKLLVGGATDASYSFG